MGSLRPKTRSCHQSDVDQADSPCGPPKTDFIRQVQSTANKSLCREHFSPALACRTAWSHVTKRHRFGLRRWLKTQKRELPRVSQSSDEFGRTNWKPTCRQPMPVVAPLHPESRTRPLATCHEPQRQSRSFDGRHTPGRTVRRMDTFASPASVPIAEHLPGMTAIGSTKTTREVTAAEHPSANPRRRSLTRDFVRRQ